MLDVMGWWKALSVFDQIFWAIALLFSFIFVIQSIASLFGADADTDVSDFDMDLDHDGGTGYGVFTVKNFIAFFTLFGWTGVALSDSGYSKGVIILCAFIAGCIMVAIMFFLMTNINKLKQSGTLMMNKAIGQTGTVYLRIPASRKNAGKVNINLQGALRELNAVTDESEDILTGSFVEVTEVLSNDVLVVKSVK